MGVIKKIPLGHVIAILIGLAFATSVVSSIDIIGAIWLWLISPSAENQPPVYINLFPIIVAFIAAYGAIYTARQVYRSALLGDTREREFRNDELDRKRLTYACDLFYDLRTLMSCCHAAPEVKEVLMVEVNKKNYLLLKDFITEETFVTKINAINVDWEIISHLDKDSLKLLFQIKSLLNFVTRRTLLLKKQINLNYNIIAAGKTLPAQAEKRAEAFIDETVKLTLNLESLCSKLIAELNSKYSISPF